jgi:hypothetical protein
MQTMVHYSLETDDGVLTDGCTPCPPSAGDIVAVPGSGRFVVVRREWRQAEDVFDAHSDLAHVTLHCRKVSIEGDQLSLNMPSS